MWRVFGAACVSAISITAPAFLILDMPIRDSTKGEIKKRSLGLFKKLGIVGIALDLHIKTIQEDSTILNSCSLANTSVRTIMFSFIFHTRVHRAPAIHHAYSQHPCTGANRTDMVPALTD